ncbi:class I SAM-dependent methyltransferase [Shewanella avicenniae]|uniref:Class I SAM-dependent methyltransferase n=1 Tax=Shewanella avicenniae TaxID=2814294 RepID=A0ABX7QSR2_9GAMM|nr:class I SAM-dependent methyltransferase [Shewanella avicenniae]QSX34072.1 class I SAM-dependent methyltransferase [Shewanella avicenniae]
MSKDFFQHKADSYEQDSHRVDNVGNIANAIINHCPLSADMQLMDFGSGTGLLLERIAPHVAKITAVDVSESMNQQLLAKQDKLACALEMQAVNLEVADLAQRFDGIISSMTLHHIKDVDAMLTKFYQMLNEGGFIAIADLDSEDGSFHSDDTGVQHFGFDRASLAAQATNAGFSQVVVSDASVVQKPHGQYPVFLLSARR